MLGEDVWAIEEGFSLVWPALFQKPLDGWLLKVGGGVSRRSNSANPSADCQPLAQILPTIEEFYRQQQLPTLVRVLSIQSPGSEKALRERGYRPEGETRTLRTHISNGSKPSRTIIEHAPSSKWIDEVTSAQQRTTAQKVAYEGHVAKITLPCAFASSLDDDGEAVSWAYGAIKAKSLYIESVVTRDDRRGQGHGKDVVRALIIWGDAHGAVTSVLQVQADNNAACRLYETLGFTEELYRYRYWRAPPQA